MKFARYLEETKIPEWKRAYIDFKGLKKRVAAIRKAKLGVRGTHLQDARLHEVLESTVGEPLRQQSYGSFDHTPHSRHPSSTSSLGRLQQTDDIQSGQRQGAPPQSSRPGDEVSSSPPTKSKSNQATGRRPSISKLLTTVTRRKSSKAQIRPDITTASLYASLEPLELSFFTYLDQELDKVHTFYNEHEDEAMTRFLALKEQLRELADHRRLFHEAQTTRPPSWAVLPRALSAVLGLAKGRHSEATDADAAMNKPDGLSIPSHIPRSPRDPVEYQHAKRRLRKAIQEFYRSLELLNDYRVLNLTGFRKALKKFEKVTRYSVQDLYMKEKIHPLRFAFSGRMDDIMRDVEEIYAARFENGDLKKARRRLKSPFLHKSHHLSTFRSGIYLGIATPALISAIYSCFQPETRQLIPEWGPLLEIYVTFLIPVVFSLLLGVNLLAWSRARINYTFIFELDVRTAIDVREYLELPAFMFATLSWTIWLSFFAIGSRNIAPTTWPIIWLGFAVVVMINPLPVFSRSSRYWFIKNVSKLLIAGTSRVEFTDFWLGDQFCSLGFSLAHIFTIGCAYSVGWHNVFRHCGSAAHWPAAYALLVLPYLSRLVHSIRRYHDSRLPTHLINGGKYLASIVTFATYYVWRSRGSRHDITFVVWCLFAVFSSLYSSSWDLLMDWSFLQRRSRHRFLRPELIYSNNTFVYYFAIISNILVRFVWVIYIPTGGPNPRLRAVAAAGLEMLRRFQWNFYRLENEQIGNTDQYRATREIPLPYSSTHRFENDDDKESDPGEEVVNGSADRSGPVLKNRTLLRMSRVSSTTRSPFGGVNGDVGIRDGNAVSGT